MFPQVVGRKTAMGTDGDTIDFDLVTAVFRHLP